MGNFIGLVYAKLKEDGVDTDGMSTQEAIEEYNKRHGNENRYGDSEPTEAENKRMQERGFEKQNDEDIIEWSKQKLKDKDYEAFDTKNGISFEKYKNKNDVVKMLKDQKSTNDGIIPQDENWYIEYNDGSKVAVGEGEPYPKTTNIENIIWEHDAGYTFGGEGCVVYKEDTGREDDYRVEFQSDQKQKPKEFKPSERKLKWLEPELTPFRDFYHTKDVDWEEYAEKPKAEGIFDTDTLGGYSAYDNDLADKSNIVWMSPKEYLEKTAEGFGNDFYSQHRQIYNDRVTINELKNVLYRHGKRFPMPYIDFNQPSNQEGRHRMFVAGQELGWDTKFPVLAVNGSKDAKDQKLMFMDAEQRRYFSKWFPNYDIETVDVNQVVKDNKILEDNSVLNRRTEHWGDKYDDYKLGSKYSLYDFNTPIQLKKEDGQYRILDGNHRMIALKNAGYDKVQVLVQK